MQRISHIVFALVLAVGSIPAALADDIVVEPAPGDGFVVRGTTVVDPQDEIPAISDPPGIWVSKGSNSAGALVIEKGPGTEGNLVCLGLVDSSDGFALDTCGTIFDNSGSLRTANSIVIDGQVRCPLSANGVFGCSQMPLQIPQSVMFGIGSDVNGPAMYLKSSGHLNSSLVFFQDHDDSQVVAVFDDDVEGDAGSEGFSIWFCDPNDVANSPAVSYDWDTVADTVTASSGTPFASFAAGDRMAVIGPQGGVPRPGNNTVFHEIVSVDGGGSSLTLNAVMEDRTGTSMRAFRCSERIYRDTDGGIVIQANNTTADPCASKPEGYFFYNDASDYYCFCNGSGDDVKMHDPATACF